MLNMGFAGRIEAYAAFRRAENYPWRCSKYDIDDDGVNHERFVPNSTRYIRTAPAATMILILE